jgi:Zn-dependent protease with chaperone function
MPSTQWSEQAHTLMNCRVTIFLLHIVLCVAVYKYMHRRGAAARVLTQSVAWFSARPKNRRLATLLGWVVTALILLAPIAAITLAKLVATQELYYHFSVLEPDRLGWLGRNIQSWVGDFLIVVLCGGCMAALDSAIYLTRDGSRRAASAPGRPSKKEAFKALRKRVAGSAACRLWFRTVAACLLIFGIYFFTANDLLPRAVRREPMPESPRKDAILALAKEANLDRLDLNIRQDEHEMNAWGKHKDEGARIDFSAPLWNIQSDKQFLAVASHELVHVFRGNFYFTLVEICMYLAFFSCVLLFVLFGPPKKEGVARFNALTRIPIYVILFAALWPGLQAVRCAIKRPAEAEADRIGVAVLIGKKLITAEDMKQALIEGERFNSTDPDPNWVARLFIYDHPPLVERLHIIDEAAKQATVQTASK